MSWKLTSHHNYTYFTNTVDSGQSLHYPANNIFYRETPYAIDICFKFDRASMLSMQKSDILDPDGVAFADNDALIHWISYHTGGLMPGDFYLDIAKGIVEDTESFDKYGRNSAIDTATAPEDIWNGSGTYTGFPTGVAETMEIFSSDIDDNGTGAGARTVTIYNLLDSSGNKMPDVTVTLTGTTPVSLGAQTYYRGGSRIKVITAGATGANEGALTLRHTTTTANIFAVMPALRNQTAIAAYTVPLGYTLYVKHVNFQLSRSANGIGSASMTFRARPFGGVFNTIVAPEITNGSNYSSGDGFFVFDERTDIKCRCESVSNNGTIITADFSGILIKNT